MGGSPPKIVTPAPPPPSPEEVRSNRFANALNEFNLSRQGFRFVGGGAGETFASQVDAALAKGGFSDTTMAKLRRFKEVGSTGGTTSAADRAALEEAGITALPGQPGSGQPGRIERIPDEELPQDVLDLRQREKEQEERFDQLTDRLFQQFDLDQERQQQLDTERTEDRAFQGEIQDFIRENLFAPQEGLSDETRDLISASFGPAREIGLQSIENVALEDASRRGLNLEDSPIADAKFRNQRDLETLLSGQEAQTTLQTLLGQQQFASGLFQDQFNREQANLGNVLGITDFQERLRQQAFQNRQLLGGFAGQQGLGAGQLRSSLFRPTVLPGTPGFFGGGGLSAIGGALGGLGGLATGLGRGGLGLF